MDTNVQERLPKALKALGLGLAAGTLLSWNVANAASAPDSFSDLAEKVSPAVVNIASVHEMGSGEGPTAGIPFDFPKGSPFEKFFKQFRDQMGPQGGQRTPHRKGTALGSGFIIDSSGYVVTNNHVVDGADEVKVRLGDDSTYTAKIVGIDSVTDLALLKIEADRSLPSVSFGDSDGIKVGDWVMAVGNPFGLGGTVTAGIVSARGRNIDAGPYDDFLQIDAPINQGNSGGPLFNLDGAVVGVNTAIYSPNGGSVGIGFAIPSNIVKNVVSQLKADGKVARGWLGVEIQSVTPEMANAMGLEKSRGAIVANVMPDGPAQKAGLKAGDVILGFAGEEIDDSRDLALTVAGQPAGKETTVTVWRDNGEVSLSVVPGEHPTREQVAAAGPEAGDSGAGSVHADSLGADLASLTADRRARFGIEDDVAGVLVTDVKSDRTYEQGLRPGDVIQKVGQTKVSSPQEVTALLEKAADRSEKAVLLMVNRQGHNLFVGMKLGVA